VAETLDFHWLLPTGGARIEQLAALARAADRLGYTGVLAPAGSQYEDPWLVTAALAPQTERLKFLVTVRPGTLSPALAAQMAATHQRISGGRLLLNVVAGGQSAEQRRFGDWLSQDERYARAEEFVTIVRGVWGGESFDFSGTFYDVEEALVPEAPDPVPSLYMAGSSPAAGPVAARHADVHLTWGEAPAAVAEQIDLIGGQAARHGRSMRFGVRLYVITRDTAREARAEAKRLRAGPGVVADGAAGTALADSHALIGSHAEVADRIEEYHEFGVSEFVLSGYPQLEEAYWFGEGVLPLLRQRGLAGAWTTPAPERVSA
jgi:alkanesulfonate monooxygenase